MTEFKVYVPGPVRCHVRTALAEAQTTYREAHKAKSEGLLWRAALRGEESPS